MTQKKRVDAIGQELKVNECVYVISKSAGIGVGLVTKFNDTMTQVNGKSNIADDCLIVVTDNLIHMGKQSTVDDLRAHYASKIVVVDPDAPPKKPTVRFMLLQDGNTGEQHLMRFEGISQADATAAMRAIPALAHMANSFDHRCLTKGQRYNSTSRGYDDTLYFGHCWRFNRNSIWSYRGLPDNIAQYVDDSQPHVVIPVSHNQPDNVVIPKK